MNNEYVPHATLNNYKKVEGNLLEEANLVFSSCFDPVNLLSTQTDFFGELWCDFAHVYQRPHYGESTIRCWYKSKTPVFGQRSTVPDIVFELIALDDGPAVEWDLWVEERVLKWNDELKKTLALRKLKGDKIGVEQRLWTL